MLWALKFPAPWREPLLGGGTETQKEVQTAPTKGVAESQQRGSTSEGEVAESGREEGRGRGGGRVSDGGSKHPKNGGAGTDRRTEKREAPLNNPPPPKAQEKGAESEQLLPDSLAPDLATEFSGPLTDQAGPSVPQGRCW